VFTLAGQRTMCFDSQVQHAFTFTPPISFFVNCPEESKVDDLFEKLSQGGQIMMGSQTTASAASLAGCLTATAFRGR
jgi:predicted 3-demethylubiquinone-9 3-methyltransferase (glyoxalase superfamily)